MKILVCNAGSTSLKFKLWEMPEQTVLAEGRVERVGSDRAIFRYDSGDWSERLEPLSIPDYSTGIQLFLDALCGGKAPAIQTLREIEAIGFKTVLAKGYYGVHVLTDDVLV